jgi:cyclic pyranopterin phosphate synthase
MTVPLQLESLPIAPPVGPARAERLRDSFGRAITDLRVSITDRCNFRCVYCRTGNEGAQYAELSSKDYIGMIRLFVSLGIEKIRLTGGEPLLRAGVVEMVQEIASLRTAYTPKPEPLDLAITTNGHLLAPLAQPLKDAGLTRITVSMDAVDPETFAAITRVPRSFDRVLAGIRAASAAGLGPVKVNCVLLRGFNENQIEAFAEFSRRENVIVRFIEWMPLEEASSGQGTDRRWTREAVVDLDEIVARLNAYQPEGLDVAGLVQLPANASSETARRYTFTDGRGEIGIIAPVSRPFCGHCSRIRLTSDGKIRTCLFSQMDHDLAGRILRGASEAEAIRYIRQVVLGKEARHHIGEAGFEKPSRSMVHIGG